MDTGKLNDRLHIGANVGIFAGLLLVGLQMQQNSNLLRLQLQQDETNSYIATELAIAGDSYAEAFQKMVEDPENLSLAEMRVLEAKLWGHNIQRWWGVYRLFEAGLVDAATWKAQVDADVRFAFGNPYSLAWWEESLDSPAIPKELLDYIDGRVKDTPRDFTAEYFHNVQRQLRKNQSVQ